MTKTALAVLTAITAAGVYADDVHLEFDQTANFAQYKTYAWRGQRITSRNPNLNNDIVKNNLRASIEKQLAVKGFQQVTARPDVWVGFQLGSGTQIETVAYPAGWRGLGTVWRNIREAKSVLVIDLTDAVRKELVWRTVVTHTDNNPAKLEDRLPKETGEAFKKYPPKM